ncbi:MAG: hypothetical protein WAU39_19580 [Polyangiales bacterium]
MIAEATKRTELGSSRASVTARNAQAKHGICLCAAQCAQLKLMPEVRCGTEALAQAAYCA